MRCALSLLALALFACSAYATEPVLMTPERGAGAIVLVRRGTTSKTQIPRRTRLELLRVEPQGEPRLRVVRRTQRASAGYVRCRSGRLPAGTYHVRQLRRGGGYGWDFGLLTIRAPVLRDPRVLPYAPGDEINVGGGFFGPRHARVYIDGRRVRIREPRGRTPSRLRIRLPRDLADGDHTLTVRTPAGTVTGNTPLRIDASLHTASERFVWPGGDIGFGADSYVPDDELRVRRMGHGLLHVAMTQGGPGDARRDLRIAFRDVLREGMSTPVNLRAEWAVVRDRAQGQDPDDPPDTWLRAASLEMTVLAYDARADYLIATFVGGLTAVDPFGVPTGAAGLQIRDGAVQEFIDSEATKRAHVHLPVRFDDAGVLDADLSDVPIVGGRLAPWSGDSVHTVAVTRWLDTEVDDPEFLPPAMRRLRFGTRVRAPVGTRIVVEMQAAPPLSARSAPLAAVPDLAAVSEWVPYLSYGNRPAEEMEGPAPEPAIELAQDPAALNGHGHRLVRLRVHLYADDPSGIGSGSALPYVEHLEVRFLHFLPR